MPIQATSERVLASKALSLENRYEDRLVNEVFKDNILLNLAYMEGKTSKSPVQNWEEVTKPFSFETKLDPAATFAFHDDVLPTYEGKVTKTTNAHFNAEEGFKWSGMYYGDGVCHLASLIYWAAKEAKLDVQAPTNHDFRHIPGVPQQYGVSIYNVPGQKEVNAAQNLYVTNNRQKPISMKFEFDGSTLRVAFSEVN